MLNKNGIEYSYANGSQKAVGYNYKTKKDNDFSVETNDLIIKVDQPRAVMTQVLFEPNQKLNDSLSYDITAWDLPLAYGVDGYALKNSLSIATKPTIEKRQLYFLKKYMLFIFHGIIESQQKFWQHYYKTELKCAQLPLKQFLAML